MKVLSKIIGTIAVASALAVAGVSSAASAADAVYLPAPIQHDVTDEGNIYDDAHWTLPVIEDVTYGIYDYGTSYTSAPTWDEYGWEPGDSILVIASPTDWSGFSDGYGIDFDVTVEPSDYGVDSSGNVGWWFPAFESADIVVTPVAPTWVDPVKGVFTDAYWVAPTVEGVTYTQRRFSNAKVQIVATAQPGYKIASGAVTQWQKIDK